ncbi:MAG TPA: sigma-70 family RNA polymerase sigma factor [Bryobacteraceae bacterium]|nr:sigma-70 family RNA polymerase sigma factor [Bryobacteraceae bacterium]
MEAGSLSSVELTRMLKAWSDGDQSALDRLTPVVYAELHRLARRNMAGEREGHLLQPSALVNEAFLRLMGSAPVEWASRTHFFAVSARLMRQILIDFARAQDTGKRGNRTPHVGLSEVRDLQELPRDAASPVDLIDLDAALHDLSRLDSRQAQVVELRYFGGLENAEIAAVLGVSEPTVVRDWRVARAWLYSRLQPPNGSTPQPQAAVNRSGQ